MNGLSQQVLALNAHAHAGPCLAPIRQREPMITSGSHILPTPDNMGNRGIWREKLLAKGQKMGRSFSVSYIGQPNRSVPGFDTPCFFIDGNNPRLHPTDERSHLSTPLPWACGGSSRRAAARVNWTHGESDLAKLGSQKRPAVVRVQTEERAQEIVMICQERGWQVIAGAKQRPAEGRRPGGLGKRR
jgi:hypothetical protein